MRTTILLTMVNGSHLVVGELTRVRRKKMDLVFKLGKMA